MSIEEHVVEYMGLEFFQFKKYHKFRCSCGKVWVASPDYERDKCITQLDHDKK